VHTFADSTLKQCVYTCGGLTYGDLNSSGQPICTASCTNTAYFMDNSTKTCVSSCPTNTFKAFPTSKTCLSKCPSGLWGDGSTKTCATSCGPDATTGRPTFKDNSTQLCVVYCPLPTVKNMSTYSCVSTTKSAFNGKWTASGNMTDYISNVSVILDLCLAQLQQ
jgi:WD40 repeat protein